MSKIEMVKLVYSKSRLKQNRPKNMGSEKYCGIRFKDVDKGLICMIEDLMFLSAIRGTTWKGGHMYFGASKPVTKCDFNLLLNINLGKKYPTSGICLSKNVEYISGCKRIDDIAKTFNKEQLNRFAINAFINASKERAKLFARIRGQAL